MGCHECPGPLVDGHTIGKGRTTGAKTQGKRRSRCKQKFQESAEGSKVTSELVTEEGKEGCHRGSSEAQRGPLGRRSTRRAKASESLPKRSVLAQHHVKAADRPRSSLTGSVS